MSTMPALLLDNTYPATLQTVLIAPWPFAKWGIDILGPFPPSAGQKKFCVVVIDYFTKWVEVEAMEKITEAKTTSFFWENIVCRFGIPNSVVTDNGKQFDNKKFQAFCTDLQIKQHFTSVAHPQSNGQAEVTTRAILTGLKKRLGEVKDNWTEELYSILWTLRTTPSRATGETPFRLAYGTEAVVPVEIGMPTWRVRHFQEEKNEVGLRHNVDLVEERRQTAAERNEKYKCRVARHFNKQVKPRRFEVVDLVLRRDDIGTGSSGIERLGPTWEAPYEVTRATDKGAYKLKDSNVRELSRTWNPEVLKKYFA